MYKIKTQPQFGLILKDRQLYSGPVVTELGIISYFECDTKNIIQNHIGGYLLRTKVLFSFYNLLIV